MKRLFLPLLILATVPALADCEGWTANTYLSPQWTIVTHIPDWRHHEDYHRATDLSRLAMGLLVVGGDKLAAWEHPTATELPSRAERAKAKGELLALFRQYSVKWDQIHIAMRDIDLEFCSQERWRKAHGLK